MRVKLCGFLQDIFSPSGSSYVELWLVSYIIFGKTIAIYLVVKYPNNSYEYEALLVVLVLALVLVLEGS